jgi:hypothetical protein
MRIFNISLNELCETFNVEGKISKYNPEFNDLSLFDKPILLNKFKEYAIQDSISLYNALLKAQYIYFKEYSVDITTILSMSTLALKIFRIKFLEYNIPTLKNNIDSFIRNGYFGGGSDYYKGYIKNGKFYDVNSLYPFSMKNPMPFEIINYYKDMSNIKLNNFFGFCLANIHCPKDMIRPMLPCKYNGNTIYPVGN